MTGPSIVEPMPWLVEAACRAMGPGIFFPERGDDAQLARSICAGYPVASECLDYALVYGEPIGVWGGFTARERQRLRRARRLALAS